MDSIQPDVLTSSSIPINNRTGYETILVILPSFFYTLIVLWVETYWHLNKLYQFLFELISIIFPLILGMTVFSDYTNILLCLLLSASTFLLALSYRQNVNLKKLNTFETRFITNSRSCINIISVIAILAVDFNIFPSRFTKMDTMGYSLMDTGVGLYVFANGIVSPESRGVQNPISNSLKGSLPLFLIGSARFISTKLLNYPVPVSEYGVHWNFFITLGITKLFTSFFLNVFNIRHIYMNALMLLVAHQLLLVCGLQNFVFGDFKRDNFIKANKEGLVSSLGFVALYLLSVYFGYILELKNKHQSISNVLKKFLIATVFSLALSVGFQQVFGISRRLANPAYVFWILFIGIFMTGLFFCLQTVQMLIFCDKKTIFVPYVYEAVNSNGLVFFLVANVMTGMVNMSIETTVVNTCYSLLIIMIYMVLNCAVVAVLYSEGIKLKL